MVLLLEDLDEVLEVTDDWGNVLQVVLFKGLELLDCGEKLNQLSDSAAEKIESTKNHISVEVELLGLGHVL